MTSFTALAFMARLAAVVFHEGLRAFTPACLLGTGVVLVRSIVRTSRSLSASVSWLGSTSKNVYASPDVVLEGMDSSDACGFAIVAIFVSSFESPVPGSGVACVDSVHVHLTYVSLRRFG